LFNAKILSQNEPETVVRYLSLFWKKKKQKHETARATGAQRKAYSPRRYSMLKKKTKQNNNNNDKERQRLR